MLVSAKNLFCCKGGRGWGQNFVDMSVLLRLPLFRWLNDSSSKIDVLYIQTRYRIDLILYT